MWRTAQTELFGADELTEPEDWLAVLGMREETVKPSLPHSCGIFKIQSHYLPVTLFLKILETLLNFE